MSDDDPVLKLVNLILLDSIRQRASDIHLEYGEKDFVVSFRIAGAMVEVMRPPLALKGSITARLKRMAELDVVERSQPQDGGFTIAIRGDRTVSFGVSASPTPQGEKLVVRRLDPSDLPSA